MDDTGDAGSGISTTGALAAADNVGGDGIGAWRLLRHNLAHSQDNSQKDNPMMKSFQPEDSSADENRGVWKV